MYFNPSSVIQRSVARYQLDTTLLENVDETTKRAEQDEFTIIHISTKVQEMIANDLAQRMIQVEKRLSILSQETVKLKHESDIASNHLLRTATRHSKDSKDCDGTLIEDKLDDIDFTLQDAQEMRLDLNWLERLQKNIKELYEKKEAVLNEKLQIKQQYCELLEKQTKLRVRIEALQKRLDARRPISKDVA